MSDSEARRVSSETRLRIGLLFAEADQETVGNLLAAECGNNLPFLADLDEQKLERFQFAALKLSGGDLNKLKQAIELAKLDWRDLLMAAGFGYEINAHERWVPDKG